MKKRKLFTVLSLGLLFMLSGCFGSSSSSSGSSDKNADSSNTSVNNSDDYFIYDGSSVKAKDTSISGDLVIPSEFNGQSITTIPAGAFKNCSQMTSIVVPKSVTTIEGGSFEGCIRLQSIELPFCGITREKYRDGGHFGQIFGTTNYTGTIGVVQHWVSDFGNTKSNTYYIPSSLRKVVVTDATQLGQCAFENCSMLTGIDLNDDIIAINNEVFKNCSGIKNINLPNIYEIKSEAFSGCSKLEEFYIGSNVTKIESNSFLRCINLSKINSQNDGEFVIPNTVTAIYSGAFAGCIKLQAISLPFCGITREKFKDGGHFGQIFGDVNYTGTTAVVQKYTSDFGNTKSNTYYIPSSLRTVTIKDASLLGEGSFQNCSLLTELNVNSGVKGNIGQNAFSNCVTPNYFSNVEIKSDIEGTIKLNGFSESGGVKNATKELEITDENKTNFNNSSCKYVYFSIYYDNYGEKVNVFENWGMVKFIFKDKDGNAIFESNDTVMKHNDKYRTDEFNHKMTIADFNKLDKVELYFWYDKQDVLGASGNWSGQDYNVKNIKVVMQSI